MIAVTAASGRLGHAILRYLADQVGAENVRGVARNPTRIDVAGIDRRAGDYLSADSMADALQGIESVVMISAPVKPGTDRVQMHRNVVAAAKQAAVRQLLYTSVIGNGDEEGTMYAATQQVNRVAEQDLQESGLDWIVARNALYLDLDLAHIIRAQDAGGVYQNNGGEGRCGYLSIDELAYATARLAADPGKAGRVYNLTGENQRQADLVELANEVFGLNVSYESISAEENIARFMADPGVAARGEEVARMLTGCFECIARGAFDVSSDYAAAAGRPARSIREQMQGIRERMAA